PEDCSCLPGFEERRSARVRVFQRVHSGILSVVRSRRRTFASVPAATGPSRFELSSGLAHAMARRNDFDRGEGVGDEFHRLPLKRLPP
ncbi:hypothetical protein, partial [uncultured Nevskia sp.]|uniref:hypothetical protein n=1 Tax=uncultured Nevskia sp. TaxID=228950 RepID=UPI0025F9C8FA